MKLAPIVIRRRGINRGAERENEKKMSDLTILYGYPWFSSEAYGNVRDRNLAHFDKLNQAGFSVEGFCLTLNPPGPCLTFKELDRKWRWGDRQLLHMYEKLEHALEGKDVLINGSGINLHPEFISKLHVFTVFQCFDDPENSENLSKPAAAAYDLCLVGNIAEVETYRTWGVKYAEWVPMGLRPPLYDPSLTYDEILSSDRDIDLFMMLDRSYQWRKDRLDKLEAAFPNAHFYGRGWPRGYLATGKEREYLRRAKIGPNIHNSTGPINGRTFYLPGNGVLQICDNKSYLGRIFELGKEVVGFDTIEECIDLCKYYLDHDEERRVIAANGWKRAVADYTEVAVFKRNVDLFNKLIVLKQKKVMTGCNSHHQLRSTALRWPLYAVFSWLLRLLEKVISLGARLTSALGMLFKGR
jgi:spore maturation protein CgeB